MKRGPRPTPTAILASRGSWRAKGSQRSGEPQPERRRPPCPKWLNATAKKKYRATVCILDAMRVLTSADGDIVARYADTWTWHRRCRQFIEAHGESFPTFDDAGNLTGYRQYPQVGLANKLAVLLGRMEEQLGLSPASRPRLEILPEAKPSNDKERFFRKVS